VYTVVGGLRVVDIVNTSAIIGGCITLGEIVALNMSGITTKPFPIDLIKIV